MRLVCVCMRECECVIGVPVFWLPYLTPNLTQCDHPEPPTLIVHQSRTGANVSSYSLHAINPSNGAFDEDTIRHRATGGGVSMLSPSFAGKDQRGSYLAVPTGW